MQPERGEVKTPRALVQETKETKGKARQFAGLGMDGRGRDGWCGGAVVGIASPRPSSPAEEVVGMVKTTTPAASEAADDAEPDHPNHPSFVDPSTDGPAIDEMRCKSPSPCLHITSTGCKILSPGSAAHVGSTVHLLRRAKGLVESVRGSALPFLLHRSVSLPVLLQLAERQA